MAEKSQGKGPLIACCLAIFWPGAFIFGFPGVMGPTWQERFGVGQAEIGQTLFFVLAAVGLFMFVSGRLQEKTGPARLMVGGTLLYGISTILVAHADRIGAVYFWAFGVGAASTFIYLPALTLVQRWYPRRRGLVSGLINLFFGFSAAVMSPVFGQSLKLIGYEKTAVFFGTLAMTIGLAAAPFCINPSEDQGNEAHGGGAARFSVKSPSILESLRTRAFWSLWGVWAMAGAAGIAMVPLSIAFGMSGGLGLQEAIVILTSFNLTNGLSRLLSGYLSDQWSRNQTMAVCFAAAGVAYWVLPHAGSLWGWSFLAAIVGFAFGTLFAVSSPLVSDCFGLRHFGMVFGLVFTAYGFLAGLLGPWLSGMILDRTGGDFELVFRYLGVFMMASAALIQLVRPVTVSRDML